MAPIQFKQSPTPAQTLESSQDARILVRETLRISADLASSSPYSPSLIAAASCGERPGVKFGLVEADFLDSSLSVLCCEEIDGRRWKYVVARDGSGGFRKSSIHAIELHSPEAPFNDLMSFVRSYVVPEGFPDSVTPSYVPYMTWRALKHFFGGAMGVFTTQTLLSSVGMSIDSSTSGSVAINWILKDGAGRVGKMLFARQGKKFDNDLIQLRFASDLVMELGAGVELATAAMPHLFLPLACAANVAKFAGHVPSLKEANSRENIFSFPWAKDRPIVLGPRFGDAFQEPAMFLVIEPLFEKEKYVVTYNPTKGNVYALFKDLSKSDDILKAAFHAHVL